jgi:lipid II isoglutaminyl synthase (glutamine-hydrolysing)
MATRTLVLGSLYPDIMSTYGDHGNVETVRRRCAWRGIGTEVRELRLGDRFDPGDIDLLMIGSGSEAQQRLIATDLADIKGPSIREAVADGAAALAVGAGYQLFGRYCQPGHGAELPGVWLFDAWTARPAPQRAARPRSITEAQADRAVGDLVLRWGDELLVGFENHSGRTYLGPTARALGQVLIGYGNNGDGREGVLYRNAVGSYLRGPCLPRNPALADFLIRAALIRRYGEAGLTPLPDELEQAARDVAVDRIQRTAQAGDRRFLGRLGADPGRAVHLGSKTLLLPARQTGPSGVAGPAPTPGGMGQRLVSAPR